jgi:hypothetical protein
MKKQTWLDVDKYYFNKARGAYVVARQIRIFFNTRHIAFKLELDPYSLSFIIIIFLEGLLSKLRISEYASYDDVDEKLKEFLLRIKLQK